MVKTFTTFIFLLFTSLFFAQSVIQDPTFGTDGWTVLNGEIDDYSLINARLQSDGKIIVTGHFDLPNNTFDYFVARLNNDGSLDTNYGTNGYFISPFLLEPFNTRIHLINDNIYLISSNEKKIIKINSDGSLDTSYGTSGFVSYQFSSSYGWNSNSYGFINNIYYDGYVDGDLNQLFLKRIDLVSGTVLSDLPLYGISNINGVYADSSNKLLIKSYDDSYSQIFFSLHSIADGTMDVTFGNNGKIESNVNDNAINLEVSYDFVERDSDNNIVHVGVDDSGQVFKVQKYTQTGQMITSFGTNGSYNHSNVILSDVKIFNNKIYLTGLTILNGEINLFMNRLNNDGSLDVSFTNSGVYVQDSNAFQEQAESLLVLSDTEFIIAGQYFGDVSNKIFVGKYLVDEDLSSADQIMNAENVKFENPVQEDLKIISEQAFNKVAIYSLNGSLVKSMTNENLNVSDLASGSYLLNIYFKNGTVSKAKMLKK